MTFKTGSLFKESLCNIWKNEFLCFKSSLQLLQLFYRTPQLCFAANHQNCSVDYYTSPDFISSGGRRGWLNIIRRRRWWLYIIRMEERMSLCHREEDRRTLYHQEGWEDGFISSGGVEENFISPGWGEDGFISSGEEDGFISSGGGEEDWVISLGELFLWLNSSSYLYVWSYPHIKSSSGVAAVFSIRNSFMWWTVTNRGLELW